MGIVVPHVNTRQAAEQAMKSIKYTPMGYRGMFGGRQSFGVPDYVKRANDQTMIVVTYGTPAELPDPIPSTFDFSSINP